MVVIALKTSAGPDLGYEMTLSVYRSCHWCTVFWTEAQGSAQPHNTHFARPHHPILIEQANSRTYQSSVFRRNAQASSKVFHHVGIYLNISTSKGTRTFGTATCRCNVHSEMKTCGAKYSCSCKALHTKGDHIRHPINRFPEGEQLPKVISRNIS